MDRFEIEKIPLAIRSAQEKEQTALNKVADLKMLMDKTEARALTTACLGRNETERREMKERFLTEDPLYYEQEKKREQAKRDAADAAIDVDYHKNKLKVAEILARMEE